MQTQLVANAVRKSAPMMPGISASNSWARKPSTAASRRRQLSELHAIGH